jgi:uncharacterized protein
MLIEFAITNFRSIKERQVLSMLPSDRVKTETRKNILYPIMGYKDLNLLTIAAIWGRNSAGKSNIVKAFKALYWLVRHSHRFTKGDFLQANESFLFDIGFQKQPTVFEIDFVAEDKKRYLYLIEFNKESILREELHYYVVSHTGKTNKRKLYIRHNGQPISYGDDYKGAKKTVETRTRTNVLFLSKLIADDDKFLEPIFSYLTNFNISDFSESYIDFQTRYFAKVATDSGSSDMETLNTALRNIDTGILYIKSSKLDTLPKNISIELEQLDEELNDEQRRKRDELVDTLKTEIKSTHRLFDGNKEIGIYETFPLGEESEGTRKFIAVFSALMLMLKKGQILIVDEFEKSFHPHITKTLISLLGNPQINTNGTQLIFTTHDDNSMDILDYDQINLVNKDYTGATEIYTVSDIRGLRGEVSPAKRYLRGEFEAIPTINNLSIHRSLELSHV